MRPVSNCMRDSPPLVPPDDLTADLPKIEERYFLPEALVLVRRLRGQPASELSQDEILMLALTAAQATLARYVEPGNRKATDTLNTILSVLDHDTVVQAEIKKLHQMQVARLFAKPRERQGILNIVWKSLFRERSSTHGAK